MDHKEKKRAARSQLVTAAFFLAITIAKYITREHLNYISIAIALVFCVFLPIMAFRTLYLLKKEEQSEGK